MSDELREAVRKIGSHELAVRKPAMDYVCAAGNQAVPALLENLTSSDGYLREVTVAVLWAIQREEGIHHPNIVQALDRLIRTEHNAINQRDAMCMMTDLYWQTKDERIITTLIRLLKVEDEFVREFSADMLGEIGDKRAVLPLIDVLKDEDWLVTRVAIEALERIGDTTAVESLISCLKDTRTDRQNRTNSSVAAAVLRKFDTPEALNAVKQWEDSQKL